MALPLQLQPTRRGDDDAAQVTCGTWAQPLSALQHQQRLFAQQGDLYKLVQVVFLQAYGGYGIEALRRFVTTIWLQDLGVHGQALAVPLASCYLKWYATELGPHNQRQFLIDLHQTCESVVATPRDPQQVLVQRSQHDDINWATADDLLAAWLPNLGLRWLVVSTLVGWHRRHDTTNLMRFEYLLQQHFAADEQDPDSTVRILLWMRHTWQRPTDAEARLQLLLWVVLYVSQHVSHDLHEHVLPPVNETPQLEALWYTLFPVELALPVYPPPPSWEHEFAHLTV